ncbi:hypothetical protein [Reyranella sp.]|uniref:hypothetical protein n=1 Tax=Reyranella sp. TaxID=1929291 RepID=UPI0025D075F4|nr:hypothetical protein [Reyranella sp.]
MALPPRTSPSNLRPSLKVHCSRPSGVSEASPQGASMADDAGGGAAGREAAACCCRW